MAYNLTSQFIQQGNVEFTKKPIHIALKERAVFGLNAAILHNLKLQAFIWHMHQI